MKKKYLFWAIVSTNTKILVLMKTFKLKMVLFGVYNNNL